MPQRINLGCRFRLRMDRMVGGLRLAAKAEAV